MGNDIITHYDIMMTSHLCIAVISRHIVENY